MPRIVDSDPFGAQWSFGGESVVVVAILLVLSGIGGYPRRLVNFVAHVAWILQAVCVTVLYWCECSGLFPLPFFFFSGTRKSLASFVQFDGPACALSRTSNYQIYQIYLQLLAILSTRLGQFALSYWWKFSGPATSWDGSTALHTSTHLIQATLATQRKFSTYVLAY